MTVSQVRINTWTHSGSLRGGQLWFNELTSLQMYPPNCVSWVLVSRSAFVFPYFQKMETGWTLNRLWFFASTFLKTVEHPVCRAWKKARVMSRTECGGRVRPHYLRSPPHSNGDSSLATRQATEPQSWRPVVTKVTGDSWVHTSGRGEEWGEGPESQNSRTPIRWS